MRKKIQYSSMFFTITTFKIIYLKTRLFIKEKCRFKNE